MDRKEKKRKPRMISGKGGLTQVGSIRAQGDSILTGLAHDVPTLINGVQLSHPRTPDGIRQYNVKGYSAVSRLW